MEARPPACIACGSPGTERFVTMLRVIVTAPTAALRERLRVLAQGADVEIAGETGDASRAHALARSSDVLIVAGAQLLSLVADHLDPEVDEHSVADGFVGGLVDV